MRVVIAGIGYRNLRDHSVGVVMADELAEMAHPPALLVEDLSYGPVAVAQWFGDEAKTEPIRRAVFVSAVERRDGRAAGTIAAYRWDRTLPAEEEIQRAVTDAVTGVILLDNTLVVVEWMKALPAEVIVVEVQPQVHEFGDALSEAVVPAYEDAKRLVLTLATDDAAAAALPVARLAGTGPDVLADTERLIATMMAHPDPAVRRALTTLLDNIDAVHRTALGKLMGAIQSMAGDAFVNRLTADPAIRLLLMSYDLLAVDRRTLAEEALDEVRGHLHAHGTDVELVEVLGGVVSVRLHGVATPPRSASLDGARRDIEDTLRARFLGFQELEIVDGASNGDAARADATKRDAGMSTFVPISALRSARRPVYHDVLRANDLPGGMKSVMVGDANVLLARVGDELFAVRNSCSGSPLPFDYSTLSGTELTCSWHGCRYDIRTGHRLDRADVDPDERLVVLPVRERDGMISVAIGTARAAAETPPA